MSLLETPTNAGEVPALEAMSLLGRCMGNFQMVERVLTTFRKTGANDLSELQAAIEQADFPAITVIAHRFQGSSSNVSALRLRDLLRRAEQLSREQSLPELLMIMTRLPTEWETFERNCELIVPSSGSSAGGPARQTPRSMETCHAGARC